MRGEAHFEFAHLRGAYLDAKLRNASAPQARCRETSPLQSPLAFQPEPVRRETARKARHVDKPRDGALERVVATRHRGFIIVVVPGYGLASMARSFYVESCAVSAAVVAS